MRERGKHLKCNGFSDSFPLNLTYCFSFLFFHLHLISFTRMHIHSKCTISKAVISIHDFSYSTDRCKRKKVCALCLIIHYYFDCVRVLCWLYVGYIWWLWCDFPFWKRVVRFDEKLPKNIWLVLVCKSESECERKRGSDHCQYLRDVTEILENQLNLASQDRSESKNALMKRFEWIVKRKVDVWPTEWDANEKKNYNI